MTFEMEHQLGIYPASIYSPATKTRHPFNQQLAAPFDTYTLDALVFVIDRATNQSIPVVKFAAADPLNHFITHFTDMPTTSKFAYDTGEDVVTNDVESRALEPDIKRSRRSRGFTMCLWIVNWALTAGTVYITLVVLASSEKMRDGVLALPITMILTIPTIRGLYVGAPPFGILLGIPQGCSPHVHDPDLCYLVDVVGFPLQIILITLCSLALLYLVIKPPPSKDPK